MRDLDVYVDSYNQLDFEKVQEEYRRRDVLSRIAKYNASNILEIGCGRRSILNDLNPDIDGYPLVLYACHAFPCHLPVFCLTYSEHPSGPFAMPLVCPAQTLVNESLTLGNISKLLQLWFFVSVLPSEPEVTLPVESFLVLPSEPITVEEPLSTYSIPNFFASIILVDESV